MRCNGVKNLRDLFNTNRNMETVTRLSFGRKMVSFFGGSTNVHATQQQFDQIAKLDWNRLDFLGWRVPA